MKFHDKLCDKIFDGFELKQEVKDKLNEISNAFIEFLEVPEDAIKDVVLTGSMMSYNYTQYSDIDLHLLVDFDKVHEDCPIVEGYLLSKKSEFNKNHDIFIYGIPVEVYAESIDNTNVHNGLYSLRQDKWIDTPKKIPPTDNDGAVELKYNEYKMAADIVDDSEVAAELIKKIREMRKSGLEEVGEFSTENLTFKRLRDTGVIGKLMEIKKKGIDKQLSLESYNEKFDKEDCEFNHELEEKIMNKLIKKLSPIEYPKFDIADFTWSIDNEVYYPELQNSPFHGTPMKVIEYHPKGVYSSSILCKLGIRCINDKIYLLLKLPYKQNEKFNLVNYMKKYVASRDETYFKIDFTGETIDEIVTDIADNIKNIFEYDKKVKEGLLTGKQDIIDYLEKNHFATQDDLYKAINQPKHQVDKMVKQLLNNNLIKFADGQDHDGINGWELRESYTKPLSLESKIRSNIMKKQLRKNEDVVQKRYKMDINSVLDHLVGYEVDIDDYYLKGDTFTVVYSEDGETTDKISITTKELEEELGVKDLVWKYDDNGSLDRISFTRETIEESIKKLNESIKKALE